MRKLMSKLIAVMCVTSVAVTSVSALDFRVDGELKNTNSMILEDRTMVPLRELNNILGYETNYISPEEIQITNTLTGYMISVGIDSDVYTLANGDILYSGIKPRLIDSTTYVPIRLISDAFGMELTFGEDGILDITTSYEVDDYEQYYQTHGDSISELLIMDFESNKDTVKQATAVFNRYVEISNEDMFEYQDEIGEDMNKLSSLLTNTYEFHAMYVLDVLDYIKNKLDYSTDLYYGVETISYLINANNYHDNLIERVDYVNSLE